MAKEAELRSERTHEFETDYWNFLSGNLRTKYWRP
jgi:hypothetical protein